MDWNKIEPKVEQLNEGLRDMMAKISQMTNANEQLPRTTDGFNAIKETIDNPMYDIVVCGEVKKGKSSLLNAIIGQDILPVANEVATSQVFRITNSKAESFELVFDDGTRKSITKEQMSYYGSQVDANLNGDPYFNGKILSYIQVNVPVAFLPENVSLIDTPGLGSVYKSHEWITNNYIKKAAGVLFVFDPETPLVEAEKVFIEKALQITNHIMFVMTKIDAFEPAHWTSQLRRTEEELGKVFKQFNLHNPVVFPMSSKSLKAAATEDEEDFKLENIRLSMFPVVKEELMAMIVRAIALSHTSFALFESQNQVIKVKSFIADMLKASAEEGQQLDDQFRAKKKSLQNELQQEWETDSANRRALSDKIVLVCDRVNNRVTQMFRPTSSIREYYISRIDSLKNMDEVKALAEEMPRSVSNDIAQQWQTIMEDAKNDVSSILYEQMSQIDTYGCDVGTTSGISVKEFTSGQKLNNIRNVIGTGFMATAVATMIFPPLGIVTGILAGVWAWITGRDTKVEQNKQHFKTELAKMFDKMHSSLVDVQDGRERSVVGEFIYTLKKNAEKVIQNSVSSKKDEMEEQLRLFESQAKLSIQEKQQECVRLKNSLTEWNNLVPRLGELCNLREMIEKEVNENQNVR